MPAINGLVDLPQSFNGGRREYDQGRKRRHLFGTWNIVWIKMGKWLEGGFDIRQPNSLEKGLAPPRKRGT